MLPRGKKTCKPHLMLKNQASSHPSEGGRIGFRRCQERGARKASPAPTARCPQFPAPGLLPLHNHPSPFLPAPHSSPPSMPCRVPKSPLSQASIRTVYLPLENTWSTFSIYCRTDITLFPPYLPEKNKTKTQISAT